MSTAPTYLICGTQRSGSLFLCRLLAETQVAGMGVSRLGDYEHLMEIVGDLALAQDWSRLDLDACLADFFQRSQSPNGVRGFKLMWSHVEQVAQARLAAGASMKTHDFFKSMPANTQYIWLSRRDTLRQAISLTRAVQTQCWADDSRDEYPGRPRFDYLRIIRSERWLVKQNEGWRKFFSRPGSPQALEVIYEDLAEDPEREIQRILKHIGVDAPNGQVIHAPATRQSVDGINNEWQERVQRIRARSRAGETWARLSSLPRWLTSSLIGQFRLRRRIRKSREFLQCSIERERK